MNFAWGIPAAFERIGISEVNPSWRKVAIADTLPVGTSGDSYRSTPPGVNRRASKP